MQADILTAFLLNLFKKINRVSLQLSNIRISIECMKSAGRVPTGPRSQYGTFQKADIFPAKLCQMIKNRRPDNATPDNHNAIMRIHVSSPIWPQETGCFADSLYFEQASTQ